MAFARQYVKKPKSFWRRGLYTDESPPSLLFDDDKTSGDDKAGGNYLTAFNLPLPFRNSVSMWACTSGIWTFWENEITPQMYNKWINEIPKRLQAVIDNDGAITAF